MLAGSPTAGNGGARLKLGLLLMVAAMLLLAQQLGVLESLGSPSALRQALLGLGGWGYVAFVAAYAILQPFGVPGTVFILAAPLVWPWPIAFALSMVGTMAASVIGFSFARFVARDWFEQRIPARFRDYSVALAKNGFSTVVMLRFIFWMPQLLHAFLGVSRVGFWTHFWGSAVGYVVPLLVTAYFGEWVFTWLRAMPASGWLVVGGSAMAVGLVIYLWRRHARRT